MKIHFLCGCRSERARVKCFSRNLSTTYSPGQAIQLALRAPVICSVPFEYTAERKVAVAVLHPWKKVICSMLLRLTSCVITSNCLLYKHILQALAADLLEAYD